MTAALRSRLLLAAPGAALAAVAVLVALEGPSADRALTALLAGVSVVLIWSVAVAVQLRYPERPLGRLLFLLAGFVSIQGLIASPNPLLHTAARALRPLVEVMVVWVMLAFPSGRLQRGRERALVAAAALAVLLLWLPSMMLSPTLPQSLLVPCRPECPRNLLSLADWPQASQALLIAFRSAGALILVATALVLFERLRRASTLMRRSLVPVVAASIARALSVAAFLLAGRFVLAVVVTLWAIPLAIALGLLRGRLHTARVLQRLVGGLQARPDRRELREVMARALEDDSLQVAYWLTDAERWVDVDGQPVALPYPAAANGRAVTLVRDDEGRPLEALVHDEALLDDPTLVEAVAASARVALASHRMEAELGASRAKTETAVEEARHRIERDLHDGAQQRLIALRMKVSVASRLLDNDPRRLAPLLAELGADVDLAMKELRTLSHGIMPPALVEQGLAGALKDAAARLPIPTRADVEEVGRLGTSVETAVYFCCLEALQNAAKHAGPAASAELALRRDGSTLRFAVRNEALGGSGGTAGDHGRGLANMRARLASIGGTLQICRSERAFSVTGSVPLGG
jgi:signal transduction histidine kinase